MNKQADIVWHFFGVENSIAASVMTRTGDSRVEKYYQRELNVHDLESFVDSLNFESDCQHYVLYSMGLLSEKRAYQQNFREWSHSVGINGILPMMLLERLNASNITFRFCYISSESASKGSFDGVYAFSKSGMETIIRETRLTDTESAVIAVAPSMIGDAGMTTRRKDQGNVNANREMHPKGRHLNASEVADICLFWFFNASHYLTNEVIAINGGKFARAMHQ